MAKRISLNKIPHFTPWIVHILDKMAFKLNCKLRKHITSTILKKVRTFTAKFILALATILSERERKRINLANWKPI